ncbi:MAG: PRC-barrel domain containing protein [Sphingomonadales bacterium]|nr:MAG: PRC-barrel domain containing protein [Sphingomonadales bacterium]
MKLEIGNMRNLHIGAFALLSMLAAPVLAQGAVAPKTGTMVYSADGKRIGRVNDIDKAADGSVKTVVVIKGMDVLHLDPATLSASDKGLTTSLSSAEVAKLK